jgi:hypothetical protein
VRAGCEEQFAGDFTARFGEHFALLKTAEVKELELLGPDRLAPAMRQRLGTYLGISPYSAQLYAEFGRDTSVRLVGVHGGLTPHEMLIPLILP